MIQFLYCLWTGLEDALIFLAMWLGCALLLWAGEERSARLREQNPDPDPDPEDPAP